ncbi:MAG: arginase family protein, partial [Deltaproteobacteria bacterium]|nr:arginase family protein [Deltaproteobacteria bacterium]
IAEHLQFLQERHVTTLAWKECCTDPAKYFKEALEKLSASCPAVAVTFDCDTIDQEYAPGVSAANTDGLTPQAAQEIIQIAAENEKVKYLDLMEMNPLFDDSDRRTARLAALLISLFCTTRSIG